MACGGGWEGHRIWFFSVPTFQDPSHSPCSFILGTPQFVHLPHTFWLILISLRLYTLHQTQKKKKRFRFNSIWVFASWWNFPGYVKFIISIFVCFPPDLFQTQSRTPRGSTFPSPRNNLKCKLRPKWNRFYILIRTLGWFVSTSKFEMHPVNENYCLPHQ